MFVFFISDCWSICLCLFRKCFRATFALRAPLKTVVCLDKSRLRELVVKVDGNLCEEFITNHIIEPIVRIRCRSAIYGRVVRIEKKLTYPNDKELTICELEVWGRLLIISSSF